jgi:hypothetical protein
MDRGTKLLAWFPIFVSPEAAFVTGASLKIDGGFTATKKVFSQLE